MWSKCSARGRHLVLNSRRPGQGRPRQAGRTSGGSKGATALGPCLVDRSLTNASLVAAARKMHRPRKTLASERWKSPNPVSGDAYSRMQAGAGLIACPFVDPAKGWTVAESCQVVATQTKTLRCCCCRAGDPPLALAGCWRRHRFGCAAATVIGDHCERERKRERQMRQPMRPHQKHSSFACRISHKVQLDANKAECSITRGS